MDPRTLAEAVREACAQAAQEAFTQGGFSGLCAEGRLELAVGAIRGLELEPLLRTLAERTADAGDGDEDPGRPPGSSR
jgi:hypothetical protein